MNGLVALEVVVREVAFSVTLCVVIGLKNKVSALVEDIISYIMIAMVWILE
jgi:hypothetical protein